MNPLDVKRKVLGAVKSFGREGMGEMLKKGYGPAAEGKPAVAIEIKSTKVEPEMGESEDEMPEGMMHEANEGMAEGMMPKDAMKMADAEVEMPAPESDDKGKITPELLEMLLAKLGK
jgi:hypothetical protein